MVPGRWPGCGRARCAGAGPCSAPARRAGCRAAAAGGTTSEPCRCANGLNTSRQASRQAGLGRSASSSVRPSWPWRGMEGGPTHPPTLCGQVREVVGPAASLVPHVQQVVPHEPQPRLSPAHAALPLPEPPPPTHTQSRSSASSLDDQEGAAEARSSCLLAGWLSGRRVLLTERTAVARRGWRPGRCRASGAACRAPRPS